MATTERLQPPVDLDALASWIYERGLGAGPITNVRKLSGGTQYIVLRFNLPRASRRGTGEAQGEIMTAWPHPTVSAHDGPTGATNQRGGSTAPEPLTDERRAPAPAGDHICNNAYIDGLPPSPLPHMTAPVRPPRDAIAIFGPPHHGQARQTLRAETYRPRRVHQPHERKTA
jgi:hypothetical protein